MTNKLNPRTRGYDKDRHSSLPYVDKPYKMLLDLAADKTGRNKKKTLELAISEHAQKHGLVAEATEVIRLTSIKST